MKGMIRLYNEHIKEMFLSKYPKKTQKTYRSVFAKTEMIEKRLGKDLYDFKLMDIHLFFIRTDPIYVSTARSYGRIITAYISYAIETGLKADGINPLKEVNTKWFDQFAIQENLYLSEDDITMIELKCENAQDAVIIRLLFEGVQGRAVSEIRNLQKSDVDFEVDLDSKDYNLRLTDEDGSIRTLLVTEKCINLIKKAYEQKTYAKKNTNLSNHENIRNYTDLVDSEYIVRSSNTSKEKKSGAVNKHVIYRRISSIEEQFELQNFNVKNISRSGMIKLAKDKFMKKGELNLFIYNMIAEQFKVKSARSIMEFANYENIIKLYDSKED